LLWNFLCNVIEIFCCYLQCVGVVFSLQSHQNIFM
jgi:hypothetical protein